MGYDVTFREFDGRHELPPGIAAESLRWMAAREPERAQKIARGFTGDPVPPSTGSGANVITNS